MSKKPRLLEFLTDDPAQADKKQVVERCEKAYKAADSARRWYETIWTTNALFLNGDQWEEAYSDIRQMTTRKIIMPPQSKVKITSNHILPLCRQASSTIVSNLPQSVATPATTDVPDVEAAELGTDFLQGRFVEDDEGDVRLHEILWAMTTGTCWRKVYWDPDAMGNVPFFGKVPVGDIAIETISPYRIHVCPWVDCSQEPPWIIESSVRDIDYINDIFHADVEAEEISDATMVLDKLLTGGGVANSTNIGTTPKRNHSAILKMMYCRPTTKYRNGRVYIWANGKWCDTTDLPEDQACHIRFSWFPSPGRLYPLPFISPLVDLQRELNITMSQCVELKNRQLRGDYVTRGVGDVSQEVDPNTGQKHLRLGAGIQDFEFVKYELNTTEAERLLARLWDDMMSVSGVHESTLGQQATGQVTATQALMLKESDTSGLSLFRQGFANQYCKIDALKLLLARNHYEIPRMTRVVGEGNSVRVRYFMGSDLRNTEDVRVKPTPMVTEAMKANMKSEAIKAGLYSWLSVQDKFAKVTALLNQGIPGMREEIDAFLAPMTYEQLREISGKLEAINAETTLLAAQMQLDGLKAQIQAQQEQATAGGAPGGVPGQPGMPQQPQQVPAQTGGVV